MENDYWSFRIDSFRHHSDKDQRWPGDIKVY